MGGIHEANCIFFSYLPGECDVWVRDDYVPTSSEDE